MASAKQLSHTLRQLIGRPVSYHGIACTVLEILENEPALVLQAYDTRSSLQEDQYGDPGRRVAETFTLPLYSENDPKRVHPDILRLGLFRLPGE